MSKTKLEYIWLDGSEKMQGLRSKTKLMNNFGGTLEDCPVWSFDGSSTGQAEGGSSDCLLKPVFMCPDPQRHNAFLVMTEVLTADGTPHSTNGRATMPQGPYYCGVGGSSAYGRELVEEHMDACIEAGLNIEGINAEVAPGQWEFQIFAKGARSAGDQIHVARYMLERTAESYGLGIEYHPKPVEGDWNGSGMHANFSNTLLRESGNKKDYDFICEAFEPVVKEHMEVYGYDNHLRLTGLHETQSIDEFSYGVSDRGASIRIPIATVEAGWKGWLEDRRPNSAADPYKVAARIIKTVKEATVTVLEEA